MFNLLIILPPDILDICPSIHHFPIYQTSLCILSHSSSSHLMQHFSSKSSLHLTSSAPHTSPQSPLQYSSVMFSLMICLAISSVVMVLIRSILFIIHPPQKGNSIPSSYGVNPGMSCPCSLFSLHSKNLTSSATTSVV